MLLEAYLELNTNDTAYEKTIRIKIIDFSKLTVIWKLDYFRDVGGKR